MSVRIWNEGHDAYGVLICKFGVSSVEEVEAFFTWLARHITGGEDEVSDTGPDAPYTAARGWVLYPRCVNSQQSLGFEDWCDRDANEPDCTWNIGMRSFAPRDAIIYFDIVFEDYNLEEDEANEGDGEERASFAKWRELLAKHKESSDPRSMAALDCEWAAIKYLEKQLTAALGSKED